MRAPSRVPRRAATRPTCSELGMASVIWIAMLRPIVSVPNRLSGPGGSRTGWLPVRRLSGRTKKPAVTAVSANARKMVNPIRNFLLRASAQA